jgi:hypothetical protein
LARISILLQTLAGLRDFSSVDIQFVSIPFHHSVGERVGEGDLQE